MNEKNSWAVNRKLAVDRKKKSLGVGTLDDEKKGIGFSRRPK
jgi:hypothetical protein